MTFVSLLFKEPYQLKTEEPQCFADLHLNRVVQTLAGSNRTLKQIFYTKPDKIETILFRQEILKDIENPEIADHLERFCRLMEETEIYLKNAENSSDKLEKNGWLLDAACTYCRALLNLNDLFNRGICHSEGMAHLGEFLSNYVSMEPFVSLHYESSNIKKLLNSIEYGIHIKENRIRVQKLGDEEDYSDEIERIFSKFTRYAAKKPDMEIYESKIISQLELNILKMVARLYPKEFLMLDEFAGKYTGFPDPLFLRLKSEIEFYLSYLKLIQPLTENGLDFCYPEPATDGEIYNYDSFDIALALQIPKSIVKNDFILHQKERILLITGPNQGGKTTFARAFGQMHYLFALGLKVPGKKAHLHLADRIYTHFEREEKTDSLKGKLEEELLRIKEILTSSSHDTLIIINEAFSSTSLQDGLFLARRIIETILKIGARAVFVTFMHELSSLDERIVSLVSMVDKDNPEKRTYRIVRMEATGASYALTLAEKHCLTYSCLKEKLKGYIK